MTNESETTQERAGGLLAPFQLESSALRGRLVRLGGAIDTILKRHAYPEKVAALLAEATALAAALGSSLKFDGIFTLQAKGNGPVSMLVADVTSDGAIRACARFEAETVASAPRGPSLLGEGHLIFTVDQTLSDERYQGIVKLEGESLTEAFQVYFRQSEQIPTGLMVAAGQSASGDWQAACLMLQQMPRDGATVPTDTAVQDDWLRAMALMQTCTAQELLDSSLAAEDLLFRLFHEEGVRVYDTRAFRGACRCSAAKIRPLLAGMSEEERAALKNEAGLWEATCQFCNQTYTFTEDELVSTTPKTA